MLLNDLADNILVSVQINFSHLNLFLDGLLRRREQILDDFVGSDGQARRFASAMGIQQQRSQPVYEDLEDYGVPMPRGRLHQLNYRDNPPRRPVIRRVVEDRGGYIEQPRTQVIQVVERVRSAPQRRIQVSFLPI